MRVAHLPPPEELDRMSTRELRNSFLVEGLFETGKINLVSTGLCDLVVGAVMPPPESGYSAEGRETGIINVGEAGAVVVGGQRYPLNKLDCLYIGIQEEDIRFEAGPAGQPAFYLLSCPADAKHPTRKLPREEVVGEEIGDRSRASKRRIYKYIHPGGIRSCRLVMGFTELEAGSVWNTMPPHTHGRRSEIYLYFDLEDRIVVHLMGLPECTRHLIVRDRQAVLSPAWSIHTGAGAGSYRFVWGMAGENQEFADMDPVPLERLF